MNSKGTLLQLAILQTQKLPLHQPSQLGCEIQNRKGLRQIWKIETNKVLFPGASCYVLIGTQVAENNIEQMHTRADVYQIPLSRWGGGVYCVRVFSSNIQKRDKLANKL